ncbi:MAG: CpsD/CapB family tyrosine-protein kinase [Rhodobacteraceae bacterium]|nr:CpsD/CapB family tyrosine-protein kinase [Paracoccaceae bacterium]
MAKAKQAGQSDSDLKLVKGAAGDIWAGLTGARISTQQLNRSKVISAMRKDPSHVAIDMLRTRLLQAMQEHGWRRVGITSATKGCGKTFVASNLAVAMARGESRRVVLIDMDLRNPGLAQVFGVPSPPRLRDYLGGYQLAEEYFLKVGQNLVLGLNSTIESGASELLLETMTAEVLAEMCSLFRPDVVIYDLPSALDHDDVIAFLPQLDGMLLVVGGGETTADEVREVERMLGDTVPLIGVVLNKGEGGG